MGSYVTGIGVISAIGRNVKENLDALMAKKSGISRLTHFESAREVPVGEVKYTDGQLRKMLGLPEKSTYSAHRPSRHGGGTGSRLGCWNRSALRVAGRTYLLHLGGWYGFERRLL